MSKGPSNKRIEAEFQTFLEEYDQHDVGLTVFDGRLKQLEDNANEDGGSFSDLIEPGLEVLNQDWLYYEEVALVTGRVYITNGAQTEQLTALWGEPDIDDDGNISYFVEDAELKSYGIVDGPHGREFDEDTTAARIGYGFVLPDSNSPYSQFILYPGEASRHQYAQPTPEAIDVKLHRFWQDEMKLIDQLIHPKEREVAKLPGRLAAIARRLEGSFRASADFREWVSIYINEKLKLDQVWPYMVEIQNELNFQDSEDQEGGWLEVVCDDAVVLHGRRPRIEFVREEGQDSEQISARLFLEIPDAEDEWKGTQISIKMENVVRLRGTRAYRSIIDRALGVAERNLGNTLSQEFEWEKSGTEDVNLKMPERPTHSGDPLFVEEMKLLDSELSAVMKDIAPLARKSFNTLEQAADVSRQLVTMAADRLIGAGLANYMLEFDGERAARPHTIRELGEEVQPGRFILQVDAENPFSKLQHGDSFQGSFYALYGDTDTTMDEETQEERHYPSPKLIVDVGSQTTNMLTTKDVMPLLEVETRWRGMIPLDGSVKIAIPSLERYMADKQARMAAAAAYGRDPIVKQINKLFSAFHGESDAGYQELAHPENIRMIASRIEQGTLAGGTQAALEALESMFIKRGLIVTGDTITQSGDLEEMGFTEGIAVDVQMKIPMSELETPYLVMLSKDDGSYRYVRLATTGAMAF